MAGGDPGFLQRKLRLILQINDTPHAIALGTAIGMFLAMTPTVGIQIILAAVVCTAVRANRVAAVVMVFISNPLTMIPIYWIDYWLGSVITGNEMISEAAFDASWQQIKAAGMIGGIREALIVLTGELFVPMMIGGSLIGIVLGVPLYPLTRRAVRSNRTRHEARIAYERLRELRAETSSAIGSVPRVAAVEPRALPEVEREELLR